MPKRHSRAGENPEWMGEGRIPPSPPSQLQVGPLAVVVSADGYDAEEVCATSLTDWHSSD